MIRVHAPSAGSVEIEREGAERAPMTREPSGHFVGEASGRYWLRVDGQRVIDPRALDVESLAGPCVAIDLDDFAWTDGDFSPPPLGVIYELHVGTFSPEGTFDGAAKKLDHLVSLGVTHVELMPVATFSGERGWGYDGAALYAPHRAYGGPRGLQRFVDAAHAHGIGVVLDVVYNHVGPIGCPLAQLGPYFHDGRPTPWGQAVNLDGPGSEAVRRFFLDNALHWLRHYHVDGLRLDAVHALHDESATHFLEELSSEVDALAEETGKPRLLIAESDLNDPRVVRTREEHGYGMHAQWSDDYHHALHVLLTGEKSGYYRDFQGRDGESALSLLAHALTHGFVYEGQRSEHRDRRHGRALGDVSLDKLIGYAQSHDQVGNRGRGERLAQLVSTERVRIALALTLLSPFTPMLFMGEEWGAKSPFSFFTDHRDEHVARATREGRAREHGATATDPQDERTFLASKLDWSEKDRPPHVGTLELVRTLIALRKSEPDLASGAHFAVRARADERRRLLYVDRGAFRLVVSFGEPQRVEDPMRGLVLGSTPAITFDEKGLFLPADAFALCRI